MRKSLCLLLLLATYFVKGQATATICGGQTATIVGTSTLTNPSYTLNPGNIQPANGNIFVISPPVTTNYTLVAVGSNGTQTTAIQVVVNPQPLVVPTVTQMTCLSNTAAYNLNLSFSPNTNPSYTINWGGSPPIIPGGWVQPQTSGSGTLAPSIYTAYVTAAGGCIGAGIFTITPQPAPATFSLSPFLTVFSLTCIQPTQTITASNPAYSYTFYSNTSQPITDTNRVAVTFPDLGNWSVIGINPTSGCSRTISFTVAQNTVQPTSTVSPMYQAVTCANPNATLISIAASPSINITHSITANVISGAFVSNQATLNFNPSGPDTYTYTLINNANGCSSTKMFTIQAANDMPTFSLTSVPDFTIGCNTRSTTVVKIVDPKTSPTPGAPVTFSIFPPNSTVTSGALSTINDYTLAAPGTWTAVVRDGSGCTRISSFFIRLDNELPALDSVYNPFPVLSCYNPQTTISAVSNVPAATYNWVTPTGNQAGNLILVPANFASSNSTLVANYSVTITNPGNDCRATFQHPIKQNLFKPTAIIASTRSLTCGTPTIQITNQSITGIPVTSGYPRDKGVSGFKWEGPTPQEPVDNSSFYEARYPGIYTLTALDPNNGCLGTGTAVVNEDKEFPLFETLKTPVISCASAQASLVANVTTFSTPLTYQWIAPASATTNATSSRTLISNRVGDYTLTVTNTLNACATTTVISVVTGSLTGSIAPSQTLGFAPFTVEFSNNSFYNLTSGTSNNSITTVWNFGNGTRHRTDSAQTSVTRTFNQPGTYTVTSYVFRGAACSDTIVNIIEVEIPSRIVVPNIFSPNGDGVNDLFFLEANSLSEVTMEVYNRWGQLVYSLTTDKGNVAWDGKNQFGQEADEGVYLFVLRATGRDGVTYDQKGNITLVR